MALRRVIGVAGDGNLAELLFCAFVSKANKSLSLFIRKEIRTPRMNRLVLDESFYAGGNTLHSGDDKTASPRISCLCMAFLLMALAGRR